METSSTMRAAMSDILRSLLLTVQFFTRLPLPAAWARWADFSPARMRAAIAFMPAIGWLTGGLAAANEPGELEFFSPTMMQGYLQNPQATEQAFTEDGYLRSGDLGYSNGDGGFTHLSRLGDVLRIGGFLVNPAEIEEAVINLSGASACQVVAVNAAGSSRPVAFVLLPAGQTVDEAAIKQQLNQQIARYKVPIRIFSVDSFPYTMSPNGMKVKRNELRDRAQALLAQEANP